MPSDSLLAANGVTCAETNMEYFESIVQTVREPLVVLESDLTVRSASRAFYQTFRDYPEKVEGRHICDLGDGQWNIPRLRELLEVVLTRNNTFNDFEVEHEFPRIGRRRFMLNARCIPGGSRAPDLILLAMEDVTQRRQTEDALSESEEKYRLLFDTMTEGFALHEIITDDQGQPCDYRFLELNPAFERLTGYRRAELVGRRVLEVMPDIDPSWIEQYGSVALTGEPLDMEGYASHLDRWFEIFAYRTAPRQCAVIFADISARKRAEHEIIELNRTLEQRIEERAGQLRMLNEIATAANEADSLDSAIYYVLRRVCEYNGWAFGHAYLPDPEDPEILVPARTCHGDVTGRFKRLRRTTRDLRLRRGQGLPGRVYAAGEPQWSNDLAGELLERRAEVCVDVGLRAAAAFPVMARHDVVGVLEFFADHMIEPGQRTLETMTAVGTQLGRVVERERFHQELSAALLAEQRRIASALHDTVSQQLAGAALSIDRIARHLEESHQPDAAPLRELADAVRKAQNSVRRTSRDILPVGIEPGALRAAIENLAESIEREWGVPCRLECDDLLVLPPPDAATHLYFIVSEAVRNALKHAAPGRLEISARYEAGTLTLEIKDDGQGLAPEALARGGAGLRIMRYRATLIGAELKVTPGLDGGTLVRCSLELEGNHGQG